VGCWCHRRDDARRRFNIIPFIRKPARIDKGLQGKLHTEAAGILRWMIEGCLAWQTSGLAPPASVKAATASYFDNQDVFSQWLEEKCDVDLHNEFRTATSAELFDSWAKYAKGAGETTGSRKSFARLLERRGLEPYRRAGGVRAWRGARLKPTGYE
jgi:putative DNA primase/helicase